jgi:hypothetical protein
MSDFDMSPEFEAACEIAAGYDLMTYLDWCGDSEEFHRHVEMGVLNVQVDER